MKSEGFLEKTKGGMKSLRPSDGGFLMFDGMPFLPSLGHMTGSEDVSLQEELSEYLIESSASCGGSGPESAGKKQEQEHARKRRWVRREGGSALCLTVLALAMVRTYALGVPYWRPIQWLIIA